MAEDVGAKIKDLRKTLKTQSWGTCIFAFTFATLVMLLVFFVRFGIPFLIAYYIFKLFGWV